MNIKIKVRNSSVISLQIHSFIIKLTNYRNYKLKYCENKPKLASVSITVALFAVVCQ
jgi:hypothetical protein